MSVNGVGLRVVRGPNWQWQSQDGGEGGLGTVVSINAQSAQAKKAIVLWDCGNKASYRIGEDSAYDLRIIDNASCGVKHKSVACGSCKQKEIIGIRWNCKMCTEYNLCSACYMSDNHDLKHPFLRYTEPTSAAVSTPPRISSPKLDSKGIFPGATVKRSSDWKWGDQDGGQGQTGVVTEISDWPGSCRRNAVRVNWSATQHSDLYRFGFEGKVDVVATTSHLAGKYYPTHLPNLGEPEKPQSAAFPVVLSRMPFAIKDRVRINVPPQVFAKMQEGHGGWVPEMRYVVEKVGVVTAFTEKGNVQVEYDSSTKFILNPAALTKFVKPSVGDIVKIISSVEAAKTMQSGHGEWIDEMAQALGRAGKVVAYTPNGDLKVNTGGRTFVWNPECCIEPSNADKESLMLPGADTSEEGISESLSSMSVSGSSFSVGETVTIINNVGKAKQLQEGYGGWNDEMAKVLGKTGQVTAVASNGTVQVQVAGRRWWFNPKCCQRDATKTDDDSDEETTVDASALKARLVANLVGVHLGLGLLQVAAELQAQPRFNVGDIVRIERNVVKLKLLQMGHGGWNDMMLLSVGKPGKVIGIDSDGDVQVNTGLFTWTFNPDCLERITDEVPDCLIC